MPDPDTVAAFLAPHHGPLAAEASVYASKRIATLPPPADDAAARLQARAVCRQLGADGWLGWAIPEAHGGRPGAPDLRACALIREALAGASPLADAVFALQGLSSMPITIGGDAAQRARWLPAMARGDAMGAFVITEPESGSDITSLRTTARRDGDGWVLAGEKCFISNAGIADIHVVFASTDPAKGRHGIGAFLVPAGTPGLRFAEAQVLSAPHPLGRLVFDGCRVPDTARLGPPDGGFRIALETLDRLRPTVGAAACGMAERALSEAAAHVVRRKQFGKPLAEFQLTQARLARMATDLCAARLLVYRAAALKDGGAERITVPAAMAKAFATEAAQRIVDDAVQLIGGAGVLASHPVDRLYRAVRALRIYEGTTEIQYLMIARELLRGVQGGEAT